MTRLKSVRPRTGGRGDGRAAARRHLELVGQTLAWTSVEVDKQRALCDQSYAAGAPAAAAHAFAERLLAWSRTAIERRPEAVESPRLLALAELAQVVRDTADTGTALTTALEVLRGAVRFENATFFLYDRASETLVPAATSGAHVDLIPEVQFDLGLGLSSWVARTRRPILLSELRGESKDGVPEHRPGSFLSVPLLVAKDLVGVLNVGHSRPGAFTEADRDLLASAGAVLTATLARQAAYDEMRRQAVTDELTGLANRAHFESRVGEEIEKARRYGYPFSILLLDPDRFAALNDTYGRAYADSCLVSLAGVLRQSVRKSDLVARLAPGDGFALLLPHQGVEQAKAAAQRIQEAVDTHTFPRRRRLSVSLGLATYPVEAIERDALVSLAVRALDTARAERRPAPSAPVPPPPATRAAR